MLNQTKLCLILYNQHAFAYNSTLPHYLLFVNITKSLSAVRPRRKLYLKILFAKTTAKITAKNFLD